MASEILMECSTKGCPRKKKIAADEAMPHGTVRVTQPCPWHERSGDKTDGASYFDVAGNQL